MAKTKTTTQFFGELETTALVLQISAKPKCGSRIVKLKCFFRLFVCFPNPPNFTYLSQNWKIQNWRQNFPAHNQPLWMWISSLYSPEPKKRSLKCKLNFCLVRRGKRERSLFFFFNWANGKYGKIFTILFTIFTFPQIVVTIKSLF